jgi:hypothetical protein
MDDEAFEARASAAKRQAVASVDAVPRCAWKPNPPDFEPPSRPVLKETGLAFIEAHLCREYAA